MRELEFLPDWYPQVRRRRRWVIAQAWFTVVLFAGVAAWAIVQQRHATAKTAELRSLAARLDRTSAELTRLDDLLALRKQWLKQDQVLKRLGSYVESTRLVTSLQDAMTPDTSLTGITVDTEVQSGGAAGSLAAARAALDKDAPVSRRVRVTIQGVAPSDLDYATLLGNLGARPIFDQVALAYAREKAEGGRVMREFEVSFGIDLAASN